MPMYDSYPVARDNRLCLQPQPTYDGAQEADCSHNQLLKEISKHCVYEIGHLELSLPALG